MRRFGIRYDRPMSVRAAANPFPSGRCKRASVRCPYASAACRGTSPLCPVQCLDVSLRRPDVSLHRFGVACGVPLSPSLKRCLPASVRCPCTESHCKLVESVVCLHWRNVPYIRSLYPCIASPSVLIATLSACIFHGRLAPRRRNLPWDDVCLHWPDVRLQRAAASLSEASFPGGRPLSHDGRLPLRALSAICLHRPIASRNFLIREVSFRRRRDGPNGGGSTRSLDGIGFLSSTLEQGRPGRRAMPRARPCAVPNSS
jgi:hypothetical protein